MQRDAKMVSYKVVDKSAKPYVEVDVAGDKKVGLHLFLETWQCSPAGVGLLVFDTLHSARYRTTPMLHMAESAALQPLCE